MRDLRPGKKTFKHFIRGKDTNESIAVCRYITGGQFFFVFPHHPYNHPPPTILTPNHLYNPSPDYQNPPLQPPKLNHPPSKRPSPSQSPSLSLYHSNTTPVPPSLSTLTLPRQPPPLFTSTNHLLCCNPSAPHHYCHLSDHSITIPSTPTTFISLLTSSHPLPQQPPPLYLAAAAAAAVTTAQISAKK